MNAFWAKLLMVLGLDLVLLHVLQQASFWRAILLVAPALQTLASGFTLGSLCYVLSGKGWWGFPCRTLRARFLPKGIGAEVWLLMCLWLEPLTGSSFILEVVSRYEDFAVPTLQVCIIFMGQCMLLGYYGVALLAVELHEISYLNWVVAFVAVQMGALFNRGKDSELGLPCISGYYQMEKKMENEMETGVI